MPTYDYHCQKCDRTFEIFQSMKDKKLTKCPDKTCGGKVERLLGTGAGIIFKGSGFYETDYRSDSYKASAKADSEKASSGGDSKKEKKPGGAKKSGDSKGGGKQAKAST